jgi:asparagine synthase (glutamine-hydrolysing)
MTALCGWIGDALSAPESTLASMGQKLGGADLQRSAIHAPQGALLNAALRQAPAIASDGALHASILGNPQFADAELRQLAQQQGPAAALLAGYRQYGAKVLQQLHDRFCVVVLDLANHTALLAVDRFASINLAYCRHQGALAFATSLKALTAHPALPHEVDPQAIYHYLYFHMIPGPGTIYRHQQRLQPGECLLWQNGEIRLERYWQPAFEEHCQPALRRTENPFPRTAAARRQRCGKRR